MDLLVTEIKQRIYSVRGHQVVLDNDLAEFYQIETRTLNQAVQRNPDRFPSDFRFRLTEQEDKKLKVQPFFLGKHGGRRYIPFAYTEHGIAMLSSVLGNDRAVQVNIVIMRSFAQVRQVSQAGTELKRLNQIEIKLQKVERGIQQLLATKSTHYLPVSAELNNLTSRSKQQRGFIAYSQPPNEFGIESLILGKEVAIKINAIHQAVAKYFGLSVLDLKAVTRSRTVVLPRQIALYLVRKQTGTNFKEIGKGLGIKHHTTVMHAYRKISVMVEEDLFFKETVQFIQNSLGG